MIASAGLGEIWETTDECRSHIPDVGNQLGRLPPDELLLSQNESGQLARLMDPQIFAPIYLGVANVEVPDDDTIGVTVVRSLAQGKPMIDVEYRYPMPETFPDETTTLRYWGDEPRGDARFDMTMRIRIPVEELENGRPESFVVIGGPHIERQKLN